MKTEEAIENALRPRTPGEHLKQATTIAILLGCATLLPGKYFRASAMTVGYLPIGGLFGLLTGTYIFLGKRRAWHRQPIGVKISLYRDRVHE